MHGEVITNLLKFIDLDTLARTAKANQLWLEKSIESWNDRMAEIDEELNELMDEEAEIRNRNPCFELPD